MNFRSLVLSLLWRLLCRDEMVRSNGSFALKVLSPHAQTFSLGGLNVSSRLCMYLCVCFFLYSMYRNHNDTSMRCTSSLIR